MTMTEPQCGLCGGSRVIRVTGVDGRTRVFPCDECSALAPKGPRTAFLRIVGPSDGDRASKGER
jgi:hypothetical protein